MSRQSGRRWLLVPALALAGCAAVGPAYERPDLGLRESDVFAATSAPAVMPTESDLHWWRRFDDPVLGQWVERALAGNLDAAIAAERIEQARALLRGARAGRSPTLDGRTQLNTTYRRRNGSGASGTQDANGLGASVGLDFDWDADLWGGLQQAERSAAASVLRSRDLAQAARLSAAGLSARGYVAWREALHEQRLLHEAVQLRQDVARLAEVRVDAGLAPSLDLLRAQADLAELDAELRAAAARARQAELALQRLAGEQPTLQPPGPAAGLRPIPAMDEALPVPRPVDLLRLRPDVRAAEAALIAAFADVGVAESALYPQLRLPGELLLTGTGLGSASLARTLTASLGALLQMPLFDGGRRAADVEAAQSRAREAALLYRRTVLEALEQVESALVARQTAVDRQRALQRATTASETAVQHARTLYTEGLTGFLDVLEAQRTLLDNRTALMRTRADAARAAVAAFEAIGLVPEASRESASVSPPARQAVDRSIE